MSPFLAVQITQQRRIVATIENLEETCALIVETIWGKDSSFGMVTPKRFQHCLANVQCKNKCAKDSST
jgi:hypothetical protein